MPEAGSGRAFKTARPPRTFGLPLDGFQLKGTLHLPAADNPPVVIGCHGLLSDRSSPKQIALAEACNALGLAFFRFDHRGCGESAGKAGGGDTSLEGRASDLLHAIRLLESRPGLGKQIGLFGSSMGGAVCLRVASERPVAAVVTFAAPVRSLAARTPGPAGRFARDAADGLRPEGRIRARRRPSAGCRNHPRRPRRGRRRWCRSPTRTKSRRPGR
ncbi:MAG: alpha/beta hydrolase [Desulfobacterales bacterium]|nr:alpha/beta hydrolase [Desulfobacterales bacterium]